MVIKASLPQNANCPNFNNNLERKTLNETNIKMPNYEKINFNYYNQNTINFKKDSSVYNPWIEE